MGWMEVAGLVLTGGGERKDRRIEIKELFLPRNSSILPIWGKLPHLCTSTPQYGSGLMQGLHFSKKNIDPRQETVGARIQGRSAPRLIHLSTFCYPNTVVIRKKNLKKKSKKKKNPTAFPSWLLINSDKLSSKGPWNWYNDFFCKMKATPNSLPEDLNLVLRPCPTLTGSPILPFSRNQQPRHQNLAVFPSKPEKYLFPLHRLRGVKSHFAQDTFCATLNF